MGNEMSNATAGMPSEWEGELAYRRQLICEVGALFDEEQERREAEGFPLSRGAACALDRAHEQMRRQFLRPQIAAESSAERQWHATRRHQHAVCHELRLRASRREARRLAAIGRQEALSAAEVASPVTRTVVRDYSECLTQLLRRARRAEAARLAATEQLRRIAANHAAERSERVGRRISQDMAIILAELAREELTQRPAAVSIDMVRARAAVHRELGTMVRRRSEINNEVVPLASVHQKTLVQHQLLAEATARAAAVDASARAVSSGVGLVSTATTLTASMLSRSALAAGLERLRALSSTMEEPLVISVLASEQSEPRTAREERQQVRAEAIDATASAISHSTVVAGLRDAASRKSEPLAVIDIEAVRSELRNARAERRLELHSRIIRRATAQSSCPTGSDSSDSEDSDSSASEGTDSFARARSLPTGSKRASRVHRRSRSDAGYGSWVGGLEGCLLPSCSTDESEASGSEVEPLELEASPLTARRLRKAAAPRFPGRIAI
eukprot:m.288299 g.288299  ORF g.288299 m.288299 type:complete len:502 (-) comp11942_c0_seq1:258-1763(-)